MGVDGRILLKWILKEIVCRRKGVNSIHLAQDKGLMMAVMSTVVHLGVT
jgi:hypothetical protein